MCEEEERKGWRSSQRDANGSPFWSTRKTARKSQEARRWGNREREWVGQGRQREHGEPSQSQVSTRGTDGRKVDPTQKTGVWRTRQTVTSKHRERPFLGPALHLAAVIVPLPRLAMLGLPWLLQFLERAKRLPDVGFVHAVPSLLALPSPSLRLTPGLVNSSSPFQPLLSQAWPDLFNSFSTSCHVLCRPNTE